MLKLEKCQPRAIRFILCVSMASASLMGLHHEANAKEKIKPADYPELAPDKLLPPIVADLKRTIPDAYSIRDFLLCPARQIKLVDGRPITWSVTFGFNAKNDTGGYTGLTSYAVAFKDGRISMHAFSSKMPGKEGFDRLINDAIIKDLLKCPSIPDAKIQDLLARPLTVEG